MSDSNKTFVANLTPEDILWAADRVSKLDPVYQEKQRHGICSMLVAVIDPYYDEDLVIPDTTSPIGYRLQGRALALLELLSKKFQITVDVCNFNTLYELWKKEGGVAFENMSQSNPHRWKGAGPFCSPRLIFIASW